MSYAIAGSCVKDDRCLAACPVDAIHPVRSDPDFETAEQLYIDPRMCIDCHQCFEACPVGAIYPAELEPPKWRHVPALNAAFFQTR